jgi:hypothetical protein
VNERIQKLIDQIRDLEEELWTALQEQQDRLQYEIKGRRVSFESAVRVAHRQLKVGLFHWLRTSRPQFILTAPIIYSLFIPLVVLDICVTLYQAICFRVYGIARVQRSDYIVIDRHQLSYLNVIEKLNCVYCGYANGLFAYARQVASRTEQYWCPVKHARRVLDPHGRYATFMDFGDAEDYRKHLHDFHEEINKAAYK